MPDDFVAWIAKKDPALVADLQGMAAFKQTVTSTLKGGKGSGNFGHAGRPGKQGGSQPGKTLKPVIAADNLAGLCQLTKKREFVPDKSIAFWITKDGKLRSTEAQADDHFEALAYTLMHDPAAFGFSKSEAQKTYQSYREWSAGGSMDEFHEGFQKAKVNGAWRVRVGPNYISIEGNSFNNSAYRKLQRWMDEGKFGELSPKTEISWDGLDDQGQYRFVRTSYPEFINAHVLDLSQPASTMLVGLKGGPGSGNWQHAGRPGHRGGSAPQTGQPVDLAQSPEAEDKTYAKADEIYNQAIADGKKDWEAHFACLKYIASHETGTYTIDKLLNGQMDANQLHRGFGSWCGSDKIYTAASDAQRAQVKKSNVTKVYRELGGTVDQETINGVIASWSHSANDHRVESLSLQEAAAEEFGLKLSKFQKDSLEQARHNKEVLDLVDWSARPKFTGHTITEEQQKTLAEWENEQIRAIYEKTHLDPKYIAKMLNYGAPEADSPGNIKYRQGLFRPVADRPTERKVMRAIYDVTQKAILREMGYPSSTATVTLYRGMEDDALKGAKPGDRVRYHGNALESWSSDIHSAAGFGKTVLAVSVPISKIFSTARSGQGCLTEGEVILMGMDNVIANMAYTHGE